jgi:hypothetical protein
VLQLLERDVLLHQLLELHRRTQKPCVAGSVAWKEVLSLLPDVERG